MFGSTLRLLQQSDWRLRTFFVALAVGAAAVGVRVAPLLASFLPNPQLTAQAGIGRPARQRRFLSKTI